MASLRQPIPLKRRPFDMVLLGFFGINLLLVTYVISLEQIVIATPFAYAPPAWPPQFLLTIIHWWEKTFDPLLWARPAWYRATIWLDVLVFGPYYVTALYAFGRGRDWIRIPSVIWASIMFTNVFIILFDELGGAYASPHPVVVVMANAAWLLAPFIVGWRVLRRQHPFTEEVLPQPGAGA
jgi:hypothetical protein